MSETAIKVRWLAGLVLVWLAFSTSCGPYYLSMYSPMGFGRSRLLAKAVDVIARTLTRAQRVQELNPDEDIVIEPGSDGVTVYHLIDLKQPQLFGNDIVHCRKAYRAAITPLDPGSCSKEVIGSVECLDMKSGIWTKVDRQQRVDLDALDRRIIAALRKD